MKRHADRQVREEDKKQADRQACEYYGKYIQKKAWVQDGKTNWQTGLWEWQTNWETGLWTGRKDITIERVGKGWKDKPRDRLLKRMADQLRDRLMSRNGGHRLARKGWKNGLFRLFLVHFRFRFLLFYFDAKQAKKYLFRFQAKPPFRFDSRLRVWVRSAAGWCMTGGRLVYDRQPAGAWQAASWCMTEARIEVVHKGLLSALWWNICWFVISGLEQKRKEGGPYYIGCGHIFLGSEMEQTWHKHSYRS